MMMYLLIMQQQIITKVDERITAAVIHGFKKSTFLKTCFISIGRKESDSISIGSLT